MKVGKVCYRSVQNLFNRFVSPLQNYKLKYQNYNLTCFVWIWILVSRLNGRT
jgi:hypothetical protein